MNQELYKDLKGPLSVNVDISTTFHFKKNMGISLVVGNIFKNKISSKNESVERNLSRFIKIGYGVRLLDKLLFQTDIINNFLPYHFEVLTGVEYSFLKKKGYVSLGLETIFGEVRNTIKPSIGTFSNSGSPICLKRSTHALRKHSAIRCRYSGLLCPIDARSKFSRRLSVWIT